MREIFFSNRFKKDFKKEEQRRGKEIILLEEIIKVLLKAEKLDFKYKDHQLKGKYKNRRELHVKPDWLLIYKIEKLTNKTELIYCERTGSHSDLFS